MYNLYVLKSKIQGMSGHNLEKLGNIATLILHTVQTLWVLHSQSKFRRKIQNDLQFLETSETSFLDICPVAVVFLGTDNNYSQLLEMCSRAQYKLILVIHDDPSLGVMIGHTEAQISIQNISDIDAQPALVRATEEGNIALVKQLLECGASVDDRNEDGLNPVQIADDLGHNEIQQELRNYGAKLYQEMDTDDFKKKVPQFTGNA